MRATVAVVPASSSDGARAVRVVALQSIQEIPLSPTHENLPVAIWAPRIRQISVHHFAASSARAAFTRIVAVADMATQATRIIVKVVRNAVAGIAVSWLLALFLTLGDVFAGVAAVAQSFSEFYVTSMLWQHFFFCSVVFAIHMVLLRQERFLDAPQNSPSYFVCVTLLGPTTFSTFVVTSLGVVALGVGLLQLPHTVVVTLHADLYTRPLFSFLFVVAAHWKTRLIVRNMTVRGQTRQVLRKLQVSLPPNEQSTARPSRRRKLLIEIICQDLPFLLSVAAATGYVHLVEALYLGENWQLIMFAIASIAAKACIQELAKHYLLRLRRTPAVRTMAVIVATPTILIDTQLRTMLLCENMGSFSALGSVLLAVVEIAIRLAKALLVKRQVRRTASMKVERRLSARPHQSQLTWNGHNSVQDLETALRGGTSGPSVSAKLGTLHMAEVVADMYAEYMAMGCSYGALLLLHGHPRFRVCAYRSSPSAQGATVAWSLLESVALQLALELGADLSACVLESRLAGVQFAHFQQDDAFFVVFLVAIAVANMSITCGVALEA